MKKLVKILLMVGATFVTISNAETIAPFTSDGCSSFPDGTLSEKNLWLSCCVEHDKAYWQGGTKKQRLSADLELKECVESVGKPNIAKLMLSGVRVGGSPYWPTSYRWGYGWKFPKKYAELTDEELTQVNRAWKTYLDKKDQPLKD